MTTTTTKRRARKAPPAAPERREPRRIETIDDLPISALRDWPGNPRVHDEERLDRIVANLGQASSITVRPMPGEAGAYQILGGHGFRDALARSGRTTVVAEVWDLDEGQATAAVAAFNAASDRAGYDEERLIDLLKAADADGMLAATGYSDDDLADLLKAAEDLLGGDGDGENPYTSAVNLPQYEPVGPPPAVADLLDDSRAEALREQIWSTPGLPDDLRDYLIAAAGRHTRFNYRKAAEFYPHASPQVQRLMEASALVIIDVGEAIARGYANLSATIEALVDADADGSDDDEPGDDE